MADIRLVVAAALFGTVLVAGAAQAQRPELIAPSALRVCSDPRNLPFSNQALEGFENKIAALLGTELHLAVSYTWYPATMGFVRNTLGAHACDLVMGTVAGGGEMDTTNPYYHTGYMLVTREADHIDTDSLSDPALADKRFGVVARTPPTDLLLHHHLLPRTKSYDLMTDTRYFSPAHDMLRDLADGAIDVALIWGPYAGYAIAHEHMKLRSVFLKSEPGGPRLDYYIAMGVRPGEPEWRREINRAITHIRPQIDAVLKDYGIQSLDSSVTQNP